MGGRGLASSCGPVVDPLFSLEAVREGRWVPRDDGYDGIFVGTVDDMKIHLERERLSHSLSFGSHKSFTLVHPALAMACPSLSPLILRG